MSDSIPVSASTWTPISAYYPHDSNIVIKNEYIQWTDGYKAFDHEAFKEGVDYSINKESVFYLPSAKDLFTFIEETDLADAYQGTYLVLSINTSYFSPSARYVTVEDTSLVLASVSSENSFFRLLFNDNGTFSLMNGPGLYVTVEDKTPFRLTMQGAVPSNEEYKQQFFWYEYDKQLYFSTKTLNPASIGPEYEERFWSFSKVGPEKGYMKASGLMPFNSYGADGYKNDYLFNVNNFAVFYRPDGLVTGHSWVRYYNEFIDKDHNRDTEIYTSKSVSSVFINHLFDLPYNTQISISNKAMAVNFANLKNVMTGEYEYNIKK